MNHPATHVLSDEQALALVRRMDLTSSLLRRHLEEDIIRLVNLPHEFQEQAIADFCGELDKDSLLKEKGWTEADLMLHVLRPEALRRFAAQRFGPGLEDRFLGFKGGRDLVIYSLLRVRDPGLARELWIRLEEGEITFAEAASTFSEGPEAHRKGVMGPLEIGTLQPQTLQDLLRALRPGEISSPKLLGEWFVLLRLEQLTPARFDDQLRLRMQDEALDEFLANRVTRILAGEADQLDTLHYDCDA